MSFQLNGSNTPGQEFAWLWIHWIKPESGPGALWFRADEQIIKAGGQPVINATLGDYKRYPTPVYEIMEQRRFALRPIIAQAGHAVDDAIPGLYRARLPKFTVGLAGGTVCELTGTPTQEFTTPVVVGPDTPRRTFTLLPDGTVIRWEIGRPRADGWAYLFLDVRTPPGTTIKSLAWRWSAWGDKMSRQHQAHNWDWFWTPRPFWSNYDPVTGRPSYSFDFWIRPGQAPDVVRARLDNLLVKAEGPGVPLSGSWSSIPASRIFYSDWISPADFSSQFKGPYPLTRQ